MVFPSSTSTSSSTWAPTSAEPSGDFVDTTWIDAPSGYSSGGPSLITDDGDILATWYTSSSRSVIFSYDLATDTHSALLPTDTGRQLISGSNAATGDLLVTSAVGRGGKVFFLDAAP